MKVSYFAWLLLCVSTLCQWFAVLQAGDGEAEGVCGRKAHQEQREDIHHEGPVLHDQEDAPVPEGAESLLHPPAPGRGLHEVLPGLRRQAVQGGTGGWLTTVTLTTHTDHSHTDHSHWPLSHWPLSHWPLSRWPLSHWPHSRWPLSHWPLSHWPLSHWPLSLTTHTDHYHWPLSHWPLSLTTLTLTTLTLTTLTDSTQPRLVFTLVSSIYIILE